MEIRPSQPDDAPAIAEVFIDARQSLSFLPRLHSADEDRAFIRDLVERTEVWVAEGDGRIVGMAALANDTLDHLYVCRAAQGSGVGSALLAKVKEERPKGFDLWVFQQNVRGRQFYERHGCRLVRLTDGSGNEEKLPDALYSWRPGDATVDVARARGSVNQGPRVDSRTPTRCSRR